MTQTGANQHGYQTVHPDYTGIYFFCGTFFLIAIITLCVIHKISEKWRLTYYKLGQEEVKRTAEQNIYLLRKLDKVLDTLNKEHTENDG
jgi:hypothetical protein